MYKPKKQWQMYEKLMKKNLLPDEDGNVEYRLGEEQWEKDIVRLSFLKKQSPETVAQKFSTDSFIYNWITSELRGDPDAVMDTYIDFKTHGRFILNDGKYERKVFDEKISSSKWWKIIKESDEKFSKENGTWIEPETFSNNDKWKSVYGKVDDDNERW